MALSSEAIQGKDVIMEVSNGSFYEPFVCATDVRVSVNWEMISASTVGSARDNYPRRRRRYWSLSVSGVVTIITDGFTIFNALETSAETFQVRVHFTDGIGNRKTFNGAVVLESADLGGSADGFADDNIEFQGYGPYNISTSVVATGNTEFSSEFSDPEFN